MILSATLPRTSRDAPRPCVDIAIASTLDRSAKSMIASDTAHQDRHSGFAQHSIRNAANPRAIDSSAPMCRHHDTIRGHFVASLADSGNRQSRHYGMSQLDRGVSLDLCRNFPRYSFSPSINSACHATSGAPASGRGSWTNTRSSAAPASLAMAMAGPSACSEKGERSRGTRSFLNMRSP